MVAKIVMPRLSLTMKTGSIVQWFKREGEKVQKGEPIVEVLSEKVTYDVEAPAAGILRKILAEEGMDLQVGATLAFIAGPDEELPEVEAEAAIPIAEQRKETMVEKATRMVKEPILASPAAKRIAREHNIDLAQIQATAPEGRIVEEDVKRFLEEKKENLPSTDREIPLTGIRKTIAERLTLSFQTAPHSFIIMDVDMTNAVKKREETQASYTAILVYAVAKTLRENLTVNSTLVDGKIRVYRDVNLGVAVSAEKGLIVPVIKKADEKQIAEISAELDEMVDKARLGSLSQEELTGGTFTVTNLGMYDVDMFLPIINPPEAAILAAGRIAHKQVVVDKEVAVKPMMTLTLAYDHRIIDGAPASMFLRQIKKEIEEKL